MDVQWFYVKYLQLVDISVNCVFKVALCVEWAESTAGKLTRMTMKTLLNVPEKHWIKLF